MIMTKVIVDSREDKKMLRALDKVGVPYEVKQLNVADFVVKTKIGGKEDTISIERKTQNDFINSIIDKRLLNQVNMMRKNYKVSLLIIEGVENLYSMRNIHPNAIRGFMVTLVFDYGVQIVTTRNYKDTALFIQRIVERLNKARKPLSLSDRRIPLTVNEQKLYVLESLPGVGPVLAKNLLKEFGSVEKVFLASVDELQDVDKMGPKKAKKIKEIIEI